MTAARAIPPRPQLPAPAPKATPAPNAMMYQALMDSLRAVDLRPEDRRLLVRLSALDPQVVAALCELLIRSTVSTVPASEHESAVRAAALGLSGRHQQILQLISEGKTNIQIADSLVVSENTIKTHIKRLFQYLGVTDRAEAVRRGFELRILRIGVTYQTVGLR